MPVEMFLKLDQVTGGSQNFTYKGWSDVASWGWGMVSNRSSVHASEKDLTSFREISITKQIGSDSTAIMLLYAQGRTIPFADLIVIPIVAQRESKRKYLALRMEDVRVKSIVTGGSSSEEFFSEKIVLLFDRVKFEYSNYAPSTQTHPDGSTTDYTFNWDIVKNAKV